jgi:HlyD family secretion protein
MKKWFILGGLSLLLIFAALGILNLSEPKPKTVEIARTTPGDIVDYVKGTGRVEAVEEEVVRAKETMRVEKILLEEGEKVESGQLLLKIDLTEKEDAVQKARLKLEQSRIAVEEAKGKLQGSERTYGDPAEVQQNIRAKETTYEQAIIEKKAAERELKAAHELYDAGAESLLKLRAKEDRLKEADIRLAHAEEELEEAKQFFAKKEKTNINRATLKAEYERAARQEELAKAELDMAMSHLGRLQVASPINGTIVDIHVKEGMLIPAGQQILTIADLERLQVRTDVDEIDAGKIKTKQDALITFEAFAGKVFHGHVAKISPQAEIKKDRTVVEAMILIDEHTDLLKISNQVDIKIIVQRRDDVLRIPLTALHHDSAPFVWLYENGFANKVDVNTGLSDLDFVEIVDGLNEGDQVVITRGVTLTDGEAVTTE